MAVVGGGVLGINSEIVVGGVIGPGIGDVVGITVGVANSEIPVGREIWVAVAVVLCTCKLLTEI